jgi:hypothetical protein
MRIKSTAIALCCLLSLRVLASAQEPAAPPANGQIPRPLNSSKSSDLASIDEAIKSDDNFEVQQALDNAVALVSDSKNS